MWLHLASIPSPLTVLARRLCSAARRRHDLVWLAFKVLIFVIVLLAVWLFPSAAAYASGADSPRTDPPPQARGPVAPPSGQMRDDPGPVVGAETGSGPRLRASLEEDGPAAIDPPGVDSPPSPRAAVAGAPPFVGPASPASEPVEQRVGPSLPLLAAPPSRPPSRQLDYLAIAEDLQRRGRFLLDPVPSVDGAGGGEEVRRELFQLALAASPLVGDSDNPREVLGAVARELFDRRGLRVTDAPDLTPDTVLPLRALRAGTACAEVVGLVVLAVAEIVRPELDYRFAILPGGGLVRYERDGYVLQRAVLPGREGEPLTEREVEQRFRSAGLEWPSAPSPRGRPLTPREFQGCLLFRLGSLAAELERHGGDQDRATALLLESRRLFPDWAEPSIAIAVRAHESGRLAVALEQVRSALADDPLHPLARELEARYSWESGDRARAREAFEDLRRQSPDRSAEWLLALGDLEAESGRRRVAGERYREALGAATGEAGREDLVAIIERRLRDHEIAGEIEVLRRPETPYSRKFQAIRRLASQPTREALAGLVETLRDPNFRLGRLAWKALRDTTGETLGFSYVEWQRWWLSGATRGGGAGAGAEARACADPDGARSTQDPSADS